MKLELLLKSIDKSEKRPQSGKKKYKRARAGWANQLLSCCFRDDASRSRTLTCEHGHRAFATDARNSLHPEECNAHRFREDENLHKLRGSYKVAT